ncbi:MAG TPA: GNAT family N-acetyltransferase [Caulobacteraceae bacterium]|jgi:GNAT superfamily N-acetyltransferase
MSGVAIRALTPAEVEAGAEGLADVLLDCIAGGASISFMADYSRDQALAFWRGVAASAARDGRVVLVAEDDQGPVGTVQLVPVMIDNQPHRAEVSKMLVHRRGRNQGLGERLMAAVEAEAARLGRTLLVLDTVTDSPGDRLYRRRGWIPVGTIPDFALYPDGRPCDATIFYKVVGKG